MQNFGANPHTETLDHRSCHFVAAAAGCQKDIRVSSLDATKPAKVVELARATQVSTDHPRDLRFGFRRTAAHEMDIGVVIAHLWGRFGLPVWLVSTSRGNTSVVSGALQLDVHRPMGLSLHPPC